MKDDILIVKELVKTGKWGEKQAIRGLRANFKCEYCGKDLLASVENYKEWQEDHIVPKSKGGSDYDSNIAVACRTCNVNIKGRMNPLEIVGENPTREELINAVRQYISSKRTKYMEEVASYRRIIFE